MAIKIIVDSTADLSKEIEKECVIIPLSVFFGDTEYLDGVDMSKDEFYDKLVESKELPHTSQASPDTFARVYEEVKKDGDEGIMITVSSKLSGTYQSACIAQEDYDNIRVVDSMNVATGSGILAEYALSLVKEGKSLDEIVSMLEEAKEKIHVIARLDTLTYLHKGGRISKTVAIAGNALGVKPVVQVKDGEVSLLGKARGSKKANNFLNDEVNKNGVDYSKPILLGYSGKSDEMLQTYIEDSRSLWVEKIDHLQIVQIGTVVGTHAGPDGIVVAYFGESDEKKI